jgi:hypothetical protein
MGLGMKKKGNVKKVGFGKLMETVEVKDGNSAERNEEENQAWLDGNHGKVDGNCLLEHQLGYQHFK